MGVRIPVVKKAAARAKRTGVAAERSRPVAAVSRAHAPSTPDQVVDAIKRSILLGRYVPGQRLVEADLTREQQVSRGPVREALKRLAAEGVITLSPHRGAHVRLLSRRESVELLYVVQAIVGMAVRQAASRMELSDSRPKLRAAFEQLSRRRPSDDRVLLSIDRNAFYDAIFDIAGNRELARVHPAVPTQILRMQVHSYLPAASRELQFADYRQLYDALREGEGAAAVRIVNRHARRSRQQLRQLPDAAFAADVAMVAGTRE